MLFLYWAIALVVVLFFYIFCVRGYVINWVGLAKALPGIVADILCQLWIDISGMFKRKKKADVIELDEYERRLS